VASAHAIDTTERSDKNRNEYIFPDENPLWPSVLECPGPPQQTRGVLLMLLPGRKVRAERRRFLAHLLRLCAAIKSATNSLGTGSTNVRVSVSVRKSFSGSASRGDHHRAAWL